MIKELNLQSHPEGGFFVETDRAKEIVKSPYADGGERSVSTTIYYLLTADSPSGVVHRNKSRTMHVLHQGRARYTLITPGSPPKFEQVTMGIDNSKGEVRQLMVEGGVWKMSEIPAEDLSRGDADNVGCLITEVVSPGFHWEDHEFLKASDLKKELEGHPNATEIANALQKHVE